MRLPGSECGSLRQPDRVPGCKLLPLFPAHVHGGFVQGQGSPDCPERIYSVGMCHILFHLLHWRFPMVLSECVICARKRCQQPDEGVRTSAHPVSPLSDCGGNSGTDLHHPVLPQEKGCVLRHQRTALSVHDHHRGGVHRGKIPAFAGDHSPHRLCHLPGGSSVFVAKDQPLRHLSYHGGFHGGERLLRICHLRFQGKIPGRRRGCHTMVPGDQRIEAGRSHQIGNHGFSPTVGEMGAG